MTPLGAHKPGSENESGVVTLEVGLLRENFGKHWCCATRWDPYVDGMFNHCWGTKFYQCLYFTELSLISDWFIADLSKCFRYIKRDFGIRFKILSIISWNNAVNAHPPFSFKYPLVATIYRLKHFPHNPWAEEMTPTFAIFQKYDHTTRLSLWHKGKSLGFVELCIVTGEHGGCPSLLI